MYTNIVDSMLRHRILLILGLLISPYSIADALILKLMNNGQFHLQQEGIAHHSKKSNTISYQQSAGSEVSITINPSGHGQCHGETITGSGVLSPIKITFTPNIGDSNLDKQPCGKPFIVEKTIKDRTIFLEVSLEKLAKDEWFSIITTLNSQRLQIGNIAFSNTHNGIKNIPIYIEKTHLIPQPRLLAMSITQPKPILNFGLVGKKGTTLASTKLTINKVSVDDDQDFNYKLIFESVQQDSNTYRLKSAKNEYVPYYIKIGEKDIPPDSQYSGTISAESSAISTLTINFSINGKDIVGMDGGTILSDTLTAVVTPIS